LNFSKLQQEGTRLEYKDLDLRNCVEEVLEMFAGKAGKANLDLVYYIEEDVPAQILGDGKRLRQILMNLMENAVKFTDSGDIFVGIHSIKRPADSSPELCFEVRDTGIGIANGQLLQLFKGIPVKEFQKETDAGAPGLGLVICRKLVEMMGGNIEVRSQPGQGSTFTFIIPVTPSLKITRNQAQHNNMTVLEGKKILVVDDNPTSRLTLLKQMQSWKMLPAGVDSANQALDTLLRGGFEGVLIDRNMPEMDGIQLARAIRAKYPSIPVILMNPMGNELYKQESGLFSSVLAKPVRQFMLRDHLLDIFSVTVGQPMLTKNLSEDFSQQYPMRILVAEDNLINQKIAIKILTKLGYQPALANNGKEAMEMIGHEHYDMILMDVQMPEMDGLVATRMIRTCLEIQPVIIAMTANVMQGDRDECMQAGMDDYLSKPIDMKELLSQLEKWGQTITNKRKMPD
jgi:CheY-like chemotaxis protein